MYDKKPKSYTDLLGKTNRIVEGTTIVGNIVSQADFRLDGELNGDFSCKGKIVIGPTGVVKGNIICKMLILKDILKEKFRWQKYYI